MRPRPMSAPRQALRESADPSGNATFRAEPSTTPGRGRTHQAAHAALIKSVEKFQLSLRAACTFDWPADERYRPIAGMQMPTAAPPAPAAPDHTDHAPAAALPTAADLVGGGPAAVVVGDVTDLAAWYIARQKTKVDRRGGAKPSWPPYTPDPRRPGVARRGRGLSNRSVPQAQAGVATTP